MKRKVFIILLLSILSCLLFFKKYIKDSYHNYRESQIIKSSIVWSPENKLKLSDFNYEPEVTQMDNIAVTVGIISVHNITDKITHRSTTVFRPKESFITKLDDSFALRIAQARFDLCELYRRKMELKIDSLNEKDIKKINTDTITKYEELYYDLFEKEWSKFNKIKTNELSEGLMELERQIVQQLK
ncbi:hypothetical protein QRD02_14100 [Aequorivita sp. SDUM287046]|uniref:DUF4230 domain-containing protein n=1 Tax=Aequorivita aurantiaca TaxID=3053356 RepID=A0ABT8DKE3_9FLAO|nr:hypothetical protein [Aequorivita aurantiaca]MDN3725518.1 hypothetical protein [Aequorivita aurantiaca]